MSETTEINAVDGINATGWTRRQGATKNDRSVLLGARIQREWLDQSVSLLAVRLTGDLANALRVLLEAAKSNDEKNLPIIRLRSALMAKLDGVVRLDRDLGLKVDGKSALELRWAVAGDVVDAEVSQVKAQILEILETWWRNVLNAWAERNELGAAAAALHETIKPENLDVQPRSQLLAEVGIGKQIDNLQFNLIAKHIAERLDGEELFPGMGACTVIADAAATDGSVELTTWPKKLNIAGRDSVFSMVARLSVLTWPSGKEIYLKVTPVKRVWTPKVPGRKPNAPASVRCYVFSPDKPVLPANIRLGKEGWEFGDEYQQYRFESGSVLPATLVEAVGNLVPQDGSWWVGLPELTTLFDRVQQRTVFESDEVDLFDRVIKLLPDVLNEEVPYRVLKLTRSMSQAKSEVARLKIVDVASEPGLAGAALADEQAGVDPDDDEEEGDGLFDDSVGVAKHRERLERHRVANQTALARIHDSKKPSLWVFVDGEQERRLIESSARALFGDSLRLEFLPLPSGVHGLRDSLDLPTEKGIRRFEARIERWEAVAKQIAQSSDDARHVLICAPKEVNRKAEDPVNYFAGLHAMSAYARANVHHLLPLEDDFKTKKPDVQHFIHRTQSALLDVFLAHSGMVFGVRTFVGACLGSHAPKAIYGIQVIRSQARAYTQELPASLILFTRLDVATGVTSVRFVVRHVKQTKTTEWLPLNEGLQWLGSQRQLRGDEPWLKENFADATRKVLGAIGEDDPNAIVLIDWSTVAGLWKDITDSSLSSSTAIQVVLDNVDFARAYPQMTILRLRSDRNATMVMRWVRNMTYEEWRVEGPRVPTHQTTEERRATTFKTIVELDESPTSQRRPHYLMVMGYRNTVQTKRGLSCYRSMPAMIRNKANGLFERGLLKVASDNAALPSGLEVTVLQHPEGAQPDNLAALVMGLRLGYAHYDDWTALPAPLFFVSKVRDYIVRYPELEVGGDELLPVGSDVPEVPNGGEDAAVDTGPSARLRSELVEEVLEELPALATAAEVEVVHEEVKADEATASHTTLPGEWKQVAAEPADKLPESLPHPALNRAFQAALAAPELYSKRSGRDGRKLYTRMVLGTARVRVELPSFVTRDTVVPKGAWPTDHRSIGKFWRRQSDLGIPVKPGSSAPSVSGFPDWVMKRLAIPQSLWTVDIPSVAPMKGPLFSPAYDAHERYVRDTTDEDNSENFELSVQDFWDDLPKLVHWLCTERDDESLGWVLCRMAHYPYKDIVPKAIVAIDPEALGPKATAALQYMTDCYEVCRRALAEFSGPDHKVGVHVIQTPSGRGDAVLADAPPMTVEGLSPNHYQQQDLNIFSAVAQVPEFGKAPIAQAVAVLNLSGATRMPTSASQGPSWPVPGEDHFDDRYHACVKELDALKRRHEEVIAVRVEAQQLEREQANRVAEQRAAIEARLAKLDKIAGELIDSLTMHLSVGNWQARLASQVLGAALGAEAVDRLEVQLESIRVSLDAALHANKALIDIDEGRFDGAEALGPAERRRRKAELLPPAALRLEELEGQIKLALAACPLFELADRVKATEPLNDEYTGTVRKTDAVESESIAPVAPLVTSLPVECAPLRQESTIDSPPVLQELNTSPAAVAGLHTSHPVSVGESPVDQDDETPPVDIGLTVSNAEPFDLSEPARNALLASIRSENWALAEVAADTFSQCHPGQTGQLWAAAVRGLHSARKHQSLDAVALNSLGEWLDAQTNDQKVGNTFADHLGVLGASLVPMLLEGRETRIRWAAIQYLKPRIQQHAELYRLLDRLESLDSIQLDVTPETLAAARVGLHQAMQDSIRRFRERAANWSSDPALTTTWPGNDYYEMHEAMFSEKRNAPDDKKFAVGECLAAIAKGNDDRARRLWPEVQKQAEKGLASISDIRKRVGRRKPIEGVGRDYLIGNLEATAKFISDFFSQLDRQQDSKRNSLPPKHVQFLHDLYRELQGAKEYVNALDMVDGSPAVHRSIALAAMEQTLRLMDQTAAPGTLTDEEQLLLLDHPLGRDLLPALEWQAPDDPDTCVSVGNASTLIESLAQVANLPMEIDINQQLANAAADHRAAERLLPARIIEQRLTKHPRALASMVADNDAAQREARARLAADLQDAKQRVTNAMSLNALLQTEASRMLKLIDSLVRANSAQEIGAPAKATSLYADYPHARAVLQQLVLKPLEAKIQQSRKQIELDIDEIVNERRQRNLDPAELRQFEQKANRIRERLRQGTALSVRVARNEFLLLRDDKLPLLKFDETTPAQAFGEFRDAVHKFTSGHRVLDGLQGILTGELKPHTDAPDLVGALSAEEQKEAAAFIGHWLQMFSAQTRADISQPLQAFFRSAGVPQEPTVINTTERKFFFSEKPFAGLSGSIGDVFIPPALGSDATHIDGIVIPTRGNFLQLQQTVAQVRSTTPTFVLTHQRLSLQQRAQLGHESTVLVVDDDLVAYLALNPATRLAKLLEVCLLSCRTNPYADYGQRPVPPEMFFGRKEELRKLHEVPSAAVLYGGRRLGKSSLLNQILEESKANVHLVAGGMGTGEMAIYVNIDSKSDPARFSSDYLLFSWMAIYKAMLVSSFVRTSKSDLRSAHDIREYIQGEIVTGNVATNACYLLIDEADEVMREDLQKDTPFLTSLQLLSDAVMGKCRMRYVIAGLHNLSRMTTASNSALGKATTIALQPFSSVTDIQNGIDLITKPLGALGFHFGKGDESLPMRILAVCNFYPAFIQLYCRNLVSRLYNNRSSKDLPTAIKAADLDAVERDPEFLRDIQEKFALNLNLDKRYKAIALILAEHSYAEPTGGFTGLTAAEIREHCVTYAREHFKNTAPGAYEALLDEMEKLTILERNRSRYQLRTPDIATMLGDKDDVARLLEELARDKPTEDRSRGEVRLQVRQGQEKVTLPLPSAWLRNYLQGDKGDLVVVVGNNLSGIGAFDRLRGAWEAGQEEATLEGIAFKSPEDARTWISRERKKLGPQKQRTRMVAIPSRCWTPPQLDSYASVARDQADSLSRAVTTTMRPLLVANPDQALHLAERACQTSLPLPANVVPMPAMAWSDDAVYFWLNDLENQFVRDNGPARQALLDASFGFGDVLERMCSMALQVDEALKLPEEQRKRLGASLDGFYDKIGLPATFGADDRRKLEDLLEMVHGEPYSTEMENDFVNELMMPRPHFLFAQWMGLIQAGTDGKWRVPPLYLELIKARSLVQR